MGKNDWTVRRAGLDDAEILIEFNRAIARETEEKELPLETVSRGVRRGLEQGDEVIYFVAESCDGDQPETIGCLMLTREWSDWRDGWLAWVQSVYVAEGHRGKGVFRGLLEFATEEIRKNPDVVGIRLYVEEANTRAQAVYHRTGFEDARYKVLERMF